MFLKELRKVVTAKGGADLRPSYKDLKQLAYHNSLPFVGFGFLDNLIMIMAGEYIDLTLGNYERPLCSLFLSLSHRNEVWNVHDGGRSSGKYDLRPSRNWISLVC